MSESVDRANRPVPLESGDRLSRAEFERRYHALPSLKKAELIEGIVYVPSPTRHRQHGKPHSQIILWLALFAARVTGVECSDNASVRMDLDNEPQPDAILRIDGEKRQGRSRVDADGYLEGAPELIAEVAASTASYDLGAKKNSYRRNQVLEYVVWRVLDGAIDWYVLEEGSYQVLDSSDGILRSVAFPGLWLDPRAMVEDRMDRVLEVLEQGVASAQHQEFKARLQRTGV